MSWSDSDDSWEIPSPDAFEGETLEKEKALVQQYRGEIEEAMLGVIERDQERSKFPVGFGEEGARRAAILIVALKKAGWKGSRRYYESYGDTVYVLVAKE